MKFEPGKSGNPRGRPRRPPSVGQLLKRVVGESDPQVLERLCRRIFEAALSGDVSAARWVVENLREA
ncbi:MAG: hypothetical protein A3K19_29155 [Lentisphaerae bacterium RIFOXYB12_FULL_65_16]|nr:MAG: hypothetical protein A3K18_04545 [Lentisphaerae bacterium RIFOXYA12_64_32]OGV88367.1 MAG: hypothetical protein A3K19_29155 [Lentisphaerae bacterium RIFOXYB12_FULL_65_16]